MPKSHIVTSKWKVCKIRNTCCQKQISCAAYFLVPQEKSSKQFVCFNWSRNLHEFLCLYLGTSTTNIHTIVETANDNLTQDKHQNYNLLRRHAIDWSLFRRDTHEPRHSNLPATSRVYHKFEKVCVDTSVGNRVFGPDNQLCHSITFFKPNQNTESSFRKSKFVKQSTNIYSGVDNVD